MFDGLFDLSAFGWRDAVGLLVALLAVYMLLLGLRVLRLSRQVAAAPEDSFESIRQAKLQPYLDEASAAELRAPPAGFVADDHDERPVPGWSQRPERFADQQVQAALAREVSALREEVDKLREGLAALREDLLKDLSTLRAQQGVAAFYREAMQLAEAGRHAEEIADRCGIARAEADLVIALTQARGDAPGDSGREHG